MPMRSRRARSQLFCFKACAQDVKCLLYPASLSPHFVLSAESSEHPPRLSVESPVSRYLPTSLSIVSCALEGFVCPDLIGDII